MEADRTGKDFDDRARQILMMEAAEASRQFEKLPIIEYVDILRNILYSGIWTKYDRIKSREKRRGENKECWIHTASLVYREMQAWTKSKSIPEAKQKISSGCEYQ